ncbi:MAG: hypothetical protein SV062_04795 [Thermodesulfobacteriota bacterium]|nr:hypothetical protein [Thermodesulfobacteriota bacterium]
MAFLRNFTLWLQGGENYQRHVVLTEHSAIWVLMYLNSCDAWCEGGFKTRPEAGWFIKKYQSAQRSIIFIIHRHKNKSQILKIIRVSSKSIKNI